MIRADMNAVHIQNAHGQYDEPATEHYGTETYFPESPCGRIERERAENSHEQITINYIYLPRGRLPGPPSTMNRCVHLYRSARARDSADVDAVSHGPAWGECDGGLHVSSGEVH